MKTKQPFALFLALLVALSPLALGACSGAAVPASSALVLTDEQQITKELEVFVAVTISEDELVKEMRSDEYIKDYEDKGFELEKCAKAMAPKFTMEVQKVEIEKDEANVQAILHCPDFGEAAEDAFDKKYDALKETTDTSNMSDDELIKIYVEILNDLIDDPNIPVEDKDIDAHFTKKGGIWQIFDTSSLQIDLTKHSSRALDF